MDFITVKKLKRDFGLPHVAAANLIGEQRKLAMKRYWLLNTLLWCGMLIFGGLTYTGIDLPYDAVHWIPLAMLPLVVLQQYLIHRDSRAPILARVHAWRIGGNVEGQTTV